MTIKGTLETFNLRELLQMLAFNQKVGTLVLETERGARTIYVDQGKATFMEADPLISLAVLRIIRRKGTIDPDRLNRAAEIQERSDRFLGDVLKEMGVIEAQERDEVFEASISVRLFNAQLCSINRFEFVDGEALNPDGTPGTPIEPMLPVDGLLLDLTRKVDTWQVISEIVPTVREIFEGTGKAVDLSEEEEIDMDAAELVVPAVDGYRSLEQIADTTDVDLYSVVQTIAALFQGGGIRPVPTDALLARANELLARGEAAAALPLLRRGIERGDAPPEARLRLADALEASDDPVSAAAELDTFAALSDDGNATAVFEALHRAMTLRDGDLVSTSRLCDYYLRHRPWLREYRRDAVEAVNQLVQAASAEGRPLEAAGRLAGYIDHNDVPSEELTVLADLYTAGDERTEAAAALLRRAEDLLISERVTAARELLRRVLDLDPSRADAKRRLLELDGEKRRTQQRRRVIAVVVLLGLLALGAVSAWWTYNREAGRAVGQARIEAETAVSDGEAKARGLIEAFVTMVKKVETAEVVETDLEAEAAKMRAAVEAIVDETQGSLASYASEIEKISASTHEDTHRIILRALERRRHGLDAEAAAAISDLGSRAKRSLRLAEKANVAGQFREARAELLRARNLAFANPAVRERAQQLLVHVVKYFETFEKFEKRMTAAREAGDLAKAYKIGVEAALAQDKSDLTHSLRFAVTVESTPAGATVFLGGEPTELKTPCVVEYSPFDENTELTLRMPAHGGATTTLPTFEAIRHTPELRTWNPSFTARLEVGPQWKTTERYLYVWSADRAPMALASDARTMCAIDMRTGEASLAAKRTAGAALVRSAGAFRDGTRWSIVGHRSLRVQPRNGKQWETTLVGLLEKAPAVWGETIAVVDEVGTLYGLNLQTGAELWRKKLGSAPVQRPYASPLGFLVTTQIGAAFRVQSGTGDMTQLGSPVQGGVFALPFRKSVLLVGGGGDGLRKVAANNAAESLGSASPDFSREPFVSPEGVGWIEDDGVRWLAVDATTPVHVRALGSSVESLSGDKGELYALDTKGVLRASGYELPNEALWALALGGGKRSAPLPIGPSVFVLVDGHLVAVER